MKKPYKQPKPGDKIKLILENKQETGILLDSHEPGIILIKLNTGYNIGIKKTQIQEIKLLKEKNEDKEKKEIKTSGKKPLIHFYLTGGTISSKLDPKTGGVKDLTKPEEFFKLYPEILKIADIKIHSPFTKWSENMNFSDWAKLAKQIEKSLNNKEVKGVIISHGTDFLHYTSAALSFMLGKLNKPVILTYSQRSSDRGSSDARLNLICSAKMALSQIAEVMIIGHANTNDEYCHALIGTKCRKNHTSRRDAFRPINTKPAAKIWPDKIQIIKKGLNKRNKEKVKADTEYQEKIGLIKFYPGQNPDILNYYQKKGYKGLIIEMSGLGHVITNGKNNWIPNLKQQIKKGMIICAAAQTLSGRLHPYVYESARRIKQTGVIYLEDMLPETAYVKLGWVLGHKKWRGSTATKKKMKENTAKEYNKTLNQ